MFFTGYSRAADEVLAEQVTRSKSGDPEMIDNLHYVKDLGLRSLARARVATTSTPSPT